MTFGSVALVVGVYCHMLVLADGLERTLAVTADARNLVVLAEGATAESNSALSHDDAARLTAVPHVALGPDSRPLVSPEVVVQTDVARRGDDDASVAGVTVRGVDLPLARAVHPSVALVEGRWFQPGTYELVAGSTAARRYRQASIGMAVDCGDLRFHVVGIFRAGGGAHESEFWGHVAHVAEAYERDMYSSATIRLTSADADRVREATERIASSTVALRGVPEAAYYAGQTENARVVQNLAWMILSVMSIGAIFAAMNVMHSALVARWREIGMLRALGFSRRSLVTGFVGESTLIAVAGGLLGCAVVGLTTALGDATRDLVGSTTFTSVAFSLRLRPVHVVLSLAVSASIGILGSVVPALQATRTPVVQALRVR